MSQMLRINVITWGHGCLKIGPPQLIKQFPNLLIYFVFFFVIIMAINFKVCQ